MPSSLTAALFALLLFFTADRLWYTWTDEVYFANPALALHRGEGFVSPAWNDSRSASVFTSTAPLYSILLAGWFDLFGFSPRSVHMFGVVLWTIGLLLCTAGLHRSGLLQSEKEKLLFLLWGYLAYGCVLAYAGGRPESLQALLLGIAVFGWNWKSPRFPAAGTLPGLLAGFLLPGSGISSVFLVGALGLPAFLLFPRLRRELVSLAIGILAGIGALLAFHSACGNLGEFLGMFTQRAGEGGPLNWIQTRLQLSFWLRNHSNLLPKDPGLLAIVVCTFAALAFRLRSRESRANPATLLALRTVLCAVCGMLLLALTFKFSTYYTWIFCLVLAIGLVILLRPQPACNAPARWLRPLQIGTLAILALSSLAIPVVAAWDWTSRNPLSARNWIDAHLPPDTIVFSDFPAFYALRSNPARPARNVIFWYYHEQMTPGEKNAVGAVISCLGVSPPITETTLAETLGGNWEKIAEFHPQKNGLLGNSYRFGLLSAHHYAFAIWIRQPLNSSGRQIPPTSSPNFVNH